MFKLKLLQYIPFCFQFLKKIITRVTTNFIFLQFQVMFLFWFVGACHTYNDLERFGIPLGTHISKGDVQSRTPSPTNWWNMSTQKFDIMLKSVLQKRSIRWNQLFNFQLLAMYSMIKYFFFFLKKTRLIFKRNSWTTRPSWFPCPTQFQDVSILHTVLRMKTSRGQEAAWQSLKELHITIIMLMYMWQMTQYYYIQQHHMLG